MSSVSIDIANLSPVEKRARLAELLREKAAAPGSSYPLSYGQRALWFLYRLAPDSPAYNLIYTARVPGDLDISFLRRAFQTLVDRHPALRTTYTMRGGRPVQQVHRRPKVELEVIDASGPSGREFNARLGEEADRPFDLEQGPVMRVKLWERAEGEHVVSLAAHHIALDIWSFDILLGELRRLYAAEKAGSPAALPPLGLQYTDYVRWQDKILAGPDGEQLWAYWQNQLAGKLPTLDLPTDRARPPVQSYQGTTHYFELGEELTARLKALGGSERATLYMTLLAAFQVLLYRYSGQEDVLVGCPTIGRSRAELEGIVGYFVNPVAMRGDLSGDPTFRACLGRVRRTVLDALAHQDYPFALLVERLQPARDPSRSPIFQVAFDWYVPARSGGQEVSAFGQAETATGTDQAGPEEESFASGQRGAPFDLMLMMVMLDRSLSAALQYNIDLFDAATVERMAEHFRVLLESIVADPDRQISELPLLPAAERQRLLVELNDTRAEYPKDACVHNLFEARAQRTPDAVAVVYEDRQLTYGELDRRANQLARHLQTLGAAPQKCVGICVERSPEMMVAVLGTLKAGAAYVPLDPTYPKDRLALMVEDSGLSVLIAQDHLVGELPAGKARLLRIDSDWQTIARQSDRAPDCRATAEDLAYVIYTSGSTGKPKGVQVPHRGAVNFLRSMAREPGLAADDTLLAVTTLSFDISLLELMLPLVVGGRVVIVSRQVAADGMQLRAVLENSGITVLQATPATWRLLVAAGWTGDKRLKALCGGETLPRDLADALLPRVGSLWNVYGPTETTVWSTVYRVEAGQRPVSIGRPIANTQVYLLDKRMQPVPTGVPGEFYIGGDGLARGYLNRPQLTAEKFIAHPFSEEPGARLYCTGDLARYLPDGNIEFLGRLDHQVKIRGFRIELGEIEAVLGQHPAVREAVVVARAAQRDTDQQRLVAYFVAAEEPVPNLSALRDFLKQKLPDYMVPSAFVALDALPLMPGGKVDRRALPEPDTTRPELEQAFVAPRSPTEKLLAGLCAEVLGVDRVGVHDNFFDLGGASIQSLEIASRAGDAGLKLTPEMLFQHQTISELAAAADAAEDGVEDGPLDQRAGQAPPLHDGDQRAGQAPPLHDEAGTPSPTSDLRPPNSGRGNTLIESLGVYLPEKIVTTEEVVQSCAAELAFPLERMTGIKSRRVVADDEFAIDLAKEAVADCLANSKYGPRDIELLICCNISRLDGPHSFSFEPSTSVKLKKHFGLDNALVFDITNACVGMFTAIKIVEAFLKLEAIRCGMVVSGEYISHLTDVAQKEIEGFMDPRLACLTVGDAGIALTLEQSSDAEVGFHELDMYTLGRYSSLCIARATDQEHGGAIMHSDPIRQTAVALKQSVQHSAYVVKRSGWSPEDFQHLIMHQTSETALKDAMREINAEFNRQVCHQGNTIFNLAQRGNTATTSHAVALWDNIRNDRIRSGDRVFFGISGSGQTTGTALYTFDDLPDRLRRIRSSGDKPQKTQPTAVRRPAAIHHAPRVRIESMGTIPQRQAVKNDTIELAKAAAKDCLEQSGHDRSDLDLLMFAGVYRSGFMSEPAIASIIAGELEINDVIQSQEEKKTFAFDVISGSLSSLSACYAAAQLIRAGSYNTALVVASEIENNAQVCPQQLRGVRQTGSAVILDTTAGGKTGFGNFVFKYFTDRIDALSACTGHRNGKTYLQFHEDPKINDYYLECIPQAVHELLKIEGLDLSDIKLILPPQISSGFVSDLAVKLGVAKDRFVDVAGDGLDLFTSSLAYSLQYARRRNLVEQDDVGLIINVGSGIQVGCAVYHF